MQLKQTDLGALRLHNIIMTFLCLCRLNYRLSSTSLISNKITPVMYCNNNKRTDRYISSFSIRELREYPIAQAGKYHFTSTNKVIPFLSYTSQSRPTTFFFSFRRLNLQNNRILKIFRPFFSQQFEILQFFLSRLFLST